MLKPHMTNTISYHLKLNRWKQEALVLVSDARGKTHTQLESKQLEGCHRQSGEGICIVQHGQRCIVGCHCFLLTENILNTAACKGSANALESVVCILRQVPVLCSFLSPAG